MILIPHLLGLYILSAETERMGLRGLSANQKQEESNIKPRLCTRITGPSSVGFADSFPARGKPCRPWDLRRLFFAAFGPRKLRKVGRGNKQTSGGSGPILFPLHPRDLSASSQKPHGFLLFMDVKARRKVRSPSSVGFADSFPARGKPCKPGVFKISPAKPSFIVSALLDGGAKQAMPVSW